MHGPAVLCALATAACPPGFDGPGCGTLNLGHPLNCGTGGLCVVNSTQQWGRDSSVWTGAVQRADDGQYHMFAGFILDGCPLLVPGRPPPWITQAVVAHAVSATPAGPYALSDVALPQRGLGQWDGVSAQSPAIVRAETGEWVLYYIGSTVAGPASPTVPCNGSGRAPHGGVAAPAAGDFPEAVRNQRIGVAVARSPAGPWERRARPILPPSEPGHWDDLFTADMAPYIFDNGSALMVYKARSKADGQMRHGVAFADHWSDAEYRRLTPDTPLDFATDCEDPNLFFDRRTNKFYMILHCGCDYTVATSETGVDWRHGGTPHPSFCNTTFSDGAPAVFCRRERPQFIKDAAGLPTHLSTAVQPMGDSSPGDCIYNEERTFAMVAPLLRAGAEPSS